jgi:hypothetical protein
LAHLEKEVRFYVFEGNEMQSIYWDTNSGLSKGNNRYDIADDNDWVEVDALLQHFVQNPL